MTSPGKPTPQERIKVLSVWSEFRDTDLEFRPNPNDPRGRSVHEQMVHQCVSEDFWLRTMLAVDVSAPPLPRRKPASNLSAGMRRTARNASLLCNREIESWWESETTFFSVKRSCRVGDDPPHRAHRASPWPAMAMLRMLARDLPQQLRANRGHRWPDAAARANDLRLPGA